MISSKFLFLSFLLLFGFKGFSQKLLFRIIPTTYTSFGTFFQHRNYSKGNKIEIEPISRFGNIAWTSLNFGLQLEFYEYKKFTFGAMINNVSSQNGYGFTYFSVPNDYPHKKWKTNHDYSLKTSATRLDIGLTLRYAFDNKTDLTERWNQYLLAQFMISKNRATPSTIYGRAEPMIDGILFYTDSIDNAQSDKLGFAISLRYEWELLSRSKKKNVLNFFIGYRQGLTVTNRSYYSIWHSNGMYVNITSLSKSSAFFLGISKPINIIK